MYIGTSFNVSVSCIYSVEISCLLSRVGIRRCVYLVKDGCNRLFIGMKRNAVICLYL